jgi:hypothetical protein
MELSQLIRQSEPEKRMKALSLVAVDVIEALIG